MPQSILRLLACLAAAATLAGCGGGSPPSTGPTGPTGPTSNPTIVTYDFESFGVAPTAVAAQIGTGSFKAATLSAGVLTLTIPAGETKFGVAWVCPPPFGNNPTENNEHIEQRSTLDGTSFFEECFSFVAPNSRSANTQRTNHWHVSAHHANAQPAATGISTVSAQVNAGAISGADWVTVESEYMPWSNTILDFNVTIVDGTYDVPVTVSSGNPTFPIYDAVKILRKQTIPGSLNGGQPIVFQASDQTVPQPVTFSNIPDGFTPEPILINYEAADGLYFTYITDNPPTHFMAMPSSIAQTGDYYAFDAQAQNITNSQTVYVVKYTSTGDPQSFTFPEAWSYSGPTPAPLPTFNFAYSGFTGKTAQQASIGWTITQSPGVYAYDSFEIDASANYQDGATSITFPDLSTISGFLASPSSGSGINWTASIGQGTPFATTPPSGSESGVTATGGFTVP